MPPGRISGPTPVLSTNLCINSLVKMLGFELLPPNTSRNANSIEREARLRSNICDALDGREEIFGSATSWEARTACQTLQAQSNWAFSFSNMTSDRVEDNYHQNVLIPSRERRSAWSRGRTTSTTIRWMHFWAGRCQRQLANGFRAVGNLRGESESKYINEGYPLRTLVVRSRGAWTVHGLHGLRRADDYLTPWNG